VVAAMPSQYFIAYSNAMKYCGEILKCNEMIFWLLPG
jgi:hypothetical protein